MTDLADDMLAAARAPKGSGFFQFRPLGAEEHAAEERVAARHGYVLAGGRCETVIAFRWVLWADQPLTEDQTAVAFRNWKRHAKLHGYPPSGRVVSIFGPWATAIPEPRWRSRLRQLNSQAVTRHQAVNRS